jgi:hypothetical protein
MRVDDAVPDLELDLRKRDDLVQVKLDLKRCLVLELVFNCLADGVLLYLSFGVQARLPLRTHACR